MKKILAVILALVLALPLAGCGTPAEHYAQAVANYLEAAGAECSFESTVTFASDVNTFGATATGTIEINNGETRSASMNVASTLSPISGYSMTMNFMSYYDGSKYYANVSGKGICYKADWSEFLVQNGQYLFAETLTEADFEGILSEDAEEGELITYVVPAKAVDSFPGVKSIWERYNDGGTASLTSIQGKLYLDDDGNPVKQELTISGSLEKDGETMIVTQNVTTLITLSEENVAVELPVAVNYQEITD